MDLSEKAPIEVELSTELRCILRPVTINDTWRAKAAYQHLSLESRQSRFWQASQQLSQDLAIRLSDTDSQNHRSWIALPLDPESSLPGYGAASFWRNRSKPEQAEFSVTILDEWQRHGFGSLLLAVLWCEAWNLGIRHFTGVARPGRTAVAAWWTAAGGTITQQNQYTALSLPIENPAKFALDHRYEIHLSTVKSDLVHWFSSWANLED